MEKNFYVVITICKAKKQYVSPLVSELVNPGDIFTNINWELFHSFSSASEKAEWLKSIVDDDYQVIDAYPFKVCDITFFHDFSKVSNEK